MTSVSQTAVRDSIREVNESTWVIADRLLLSRKSENNPGCWPDDEDAWYYDLVELDAAPPTSKPLPTDSRIRLVYDAGDAHAVWRIGKAFLKAKIIEFPNETREHVTLDAVTRMKRSFIVPELLHYYEFESRDYLLVSEVPGKMIQDAWPAMEETNRRRCLDNLLVAIQEMSVLRGKQMTGIDGSGLIEYYLTVKPKPKEEKFTSAALLRRCKFLGMDCSELYFHHCDLGPTNVLVDESADCQLSIIDWEIAGFVPVDWIRTKVRVSGGFVLDQYHFEDERYTEWKRVVSKALEEAGYGDVGEKWMELRDRDVESEDGGL